MSGRDLERSAVETYVEQHGLQKLLDDLVDRVVTAKPEDALEYMVGVLREQMQSGITAVRARAVFGAGSCSTVEVEVETRAGVSRASAPAGDGSHPQRPHEALRVEADESSAHEAVAFINDVVAPKLVGSDPTDQHAIDATLLLLRTELGANAMMAVSVAVCRAGARAKDISLFRHIAELAGNHEELVLPVPVVTALSAGRLGGNNLASNPFREYLMLPTGCSSVAEALTACNAVANAVKVTLTGGLDAAEVEEGGAASVADSKPKFEVLTSSSGSAAVPMGVTSASQALELLRSCMGEVGMADKIRLGVNAAGHDIAAYMTADGTIAAANAVDTAHLPVTYRINGLEEDGSDLEELTVRCARGAWRVLLFYSRVLVAHLPHLPTSPLPSRMQAVYRECIERFSVAYIEDPFTFTGDGTMEGWAALAEEVGRDVAVVGCELIASSSASLGDSIDTRACNTFTLQPGRAGTITTAIELCAAAQKEQWAVCVASDRGDTSDDFIADLAVGVKAGMLRAGAVEFGHHASKYNQLLRIEEELSVSGGAEYVGDRFRDPL